MKGLDHTSSTFGWLFRNSLHDRISDILERGRKAAGPIGIL